MVARLASIAKRYQKVAGSSPAVVICFDRLSFFSMGLVVSHQCHTFPSPYFERRHFQSHAFLPNFFLAMHSNSYLEYRY